MDTSGNTKMSIEQKAKAYEMALEAARKELGVDRKEWEVIQRVLHNIFPELRESEDEKLKNKSGYYKAGKFWKASTLWKAVYGKSPQRVPNRYILQECTWNISSLQRFADEVKNVQEVDLNYPIILDMNGNILDGAHRVVKAYLEDKDIDIVYLGDDEWPEPDYDEEKAVKESEDERIRKWLVDYFSSIKETVWIHRDITCEQILAFLEKQKENPKNADSIPEDCASLAKCEERNSKYGVFPEDVIVVARACEKLEAHGYPELAHALKNVNLYTKEQKPVEWSEEDQLNLNWVIAILNGEPCDLDIQLESLISWLKSLRPSWKPSEEQMNRLVSIVAALRKDYCDDMADFLASLYEQLKNL